MKKLFAILLCCCMIFSLAACANDTTPTDPSQEPKPTVTDPAVTDPTVTDPTEPSETDPTEPSETDPTEPSETDPTEPSETDPTEPSETEPAQNPYENLVAHFADGVDTTDKNKGWGWDAENKYIECSKSLEAPWGTGGYGKIYLVDGVKAEEKELLYTEGIWVSCNLNPDVPVGENEGEIDTSTVTWKKGDLDEWLIFDLQTVCTVDKVTFSTLYKNGSHGMASDFTIEVSSDKQNWTTVVTQVGYEQDIASLDQVFTFNAVDCRYVRLSFTKGSTKIDNNLGYCAALSEVEIWGRVK